MTHCLDSSLKLITALLILLPVFPIVSAATDEKTNRIVSCPGGKVWVSSHTRRAYIRSNGTKVAASHVKAHCRKIHLADQFWKSKIKNVQPNNWANKKERSSRWTTETVEKVLESMLRLPRVLWSNKVKGVYRMKKSVISRNPASSDPESLVLYDEAFSRPKNIARIIAHELAHFLWRELPEDDRYTYRMATNWIGYDRKNSPYRFSRGSGFVADDGKDSPSEDFANNIEYFIFQPRRLRKLTPHAYNWIRNRFGDKLVLSKGGRQ